MNCFKWNAMLICGLFFSFIVKPRLCEQVYFCDFDNGSCPNGNISISSVTLVDSQILQGNQYRLTDVTSIITPTSNGQICDIPYVQGSFEYNHCHFATFPNYQCKTVGEGNGNCTLGKFLLGRAVYYGSLNGRATSNEIFLPEIGNYEMNFYILMFTNTTDLTADGDYIQISLYYSSDLTTSFKSEKYDYSNLGKPNKWNKKSFNFVASETKIQLIIEFVRSIPIEKFGFFGFDHFEINHMNTTTSITSEPTLNVITETTFTSNVTDSITNITLSVSTDTSSPETYVTDSTKYLSSLANTDTISRVSHVTDSITNITSTAKTSLTANTTGFKTDYTPYQTFFTLPDTNPHTEETTSTVIDKIPFSSSSIIITPTIHFLITSTQETILTKPERTSNILETITQKITSTSVEYQKTTHETTVTFWSTTKIDKAKDFSFFLIFVVVGSSLVSAVFGIVCYKIYKSCKHKNKVVNFDNDSYSLKYL